MQNITRVEFLDLPKVTFVASGFDCVPHAASYVFVSMPSLDTLRDQSRWTTEADFVLNQTVSTWLEPDSWPGLIIVDYGCTCCGGGDNLVKEHTCWSCGQIFCHDPSCLFGLFTGPDRQERFSNWYPGYRQGISGRRCTQRTFDGRLGYRAGRKQYKELRQPPTR